MAVPKKRTSKSKKNMRKTVWKNQVVKQAFESLSLARFLVKKNLENAAAEKLATTINETPNETAKE